MKKIRNDILLIVGFLIISIIMLITFYACSEKKDLYACVYYDGDLVLTIDFESLTEEKEYIVKAYVSDVVIHADSDGVWICDVGCDDLICLGQGKISNSAQTITCLPNKVIIKLVGKGVDVIV